MLEQITPIILTYNEAPNIARVLDRLTWAESVIVVDSYSTDDTLEILGRYDNVRVVQRAFDSHAVQWNFALHETGIRTEWVLALDADYVLTHDLVEEIRRLDPPGDVAGYRASFKYCVFGKPLRGTLYPPKKVLYRRQGAKYFQDGHTQRILIAGPINPGTRNEYMSPDLSPKIMDLKHPIWHDDRKSLAAWLQAQDRYMELEAEIIRNASWSGLKTADKIRKLVVVAPVLTFLYCLVAKGGALDGKAGLYYAVQRTVAEMILSLKLLQRTMV